LAALGQRQDRVAPGLRLIPGLDQFLQSAYEQNIPMAIGSAAIMFNIDFVLDNLNIRHYFKTIVSAENVIFSKPDPETYTKAADQLGVDYSSCIVFEDAPKGVEAAMNAGMKSVVLTTMHEKHEFDMYPNVAKYITNYEGLSPSNLL
jgi:HAD superfamily hydrolase (TIGR01509 family)